jgi:hypothetical protein
MNEPRIPFRRLAGEAKRPKVVGVGHNTQLPGGGEHRQGRGNSKSSNSSPEKWLACVLLFDPTHFTMHIPIRKVHLLILCALLSAKSLMAQTSEITGWFFL